MRNFTHDKRAIRECLSLLTRTAIFRDDRYSEVCLMLGEACDKLG